MLFKNMFEDTKFVPQVIKAADNETLVGQGVDMAGYEGVAFFVLALKGEALNFTMKAQQDNDAAWGTVQDLKDTSVAFATAVGTDGSAMLDIYRPQEQYVRPSIAVPNGTNPVPVAVIAVLYGGRFRPESNVGELHVSPDEGTA
jgi:hypothetical protein